MARCPSCLASIPFTVPLKNLFLSKRDPRARRFICPACGKTAYLSLAAQFLSVAFIVGGGTASAVWMLTSPSLRKQPWFGETAIFVPLFGNFFIFYYLWWKLVAKLRDFV